MRETHGNDRAQEEASPACRLISGVACEIHEGYCKKGVLEPEVKPFKLGPWNLQHGNQHERKQHGNTDKEDTARPVVRSARTDRAEDRNQNQECSVTEICPCSATAPPQCCHHDEGDDA